MSRLSIVHAACRFAFFLLCTVPARVVSAQATAVESFPASAPADALIAPSQHSPLSLDAPYATGDWSGLRRNAEEAGFVTQLFYSDSFQWIAKGGLENTGRHGATIDWFISADLGKLDLIPGGLMLIHARRQWHDGVNTQTGSLNQVADDLDGDRSLHIDQLYYEHRLASDRIWFRAGFLDFQTIVDRNAFANAEDVQFMNQQFDNNPLVPLNIGLGAEILVKPVPWFSLTAVAGDAESVLFKPGFSTAMHGPARFVWIVEPAFHLNLPNPLGETSLPGNYRLGMVSDPRPRPVFVPPETRAELRRSRGNDQGFYASFDQMLFRENATDLQGLGFFVRYGFRHGDINLIQNFWSGGLAYTGLFSSRDRDVIGAAVGQSIPSRQYNDKVNPWAEAETVAELYYACAITKWLVVTADVQYIASPGIDSTRDDTIVLGLRTRISF